MILAGTAHATWRPSLVTIPKGQLTPFGSPLKDKAGVPQTIDIRSFQVMTVPVTNSDFSEFVGENREWSKSSVKSIFAETGYLEDFASDQKLKKSALPRAPVTFVSWFASRAFCENVGMRLPTTAEWEYLAAANESKANANRDPEFLQTILNWYSEPREKGGLRQVGRGRANFYGLYDLHSLIWEWVDDFNSSLQGGEGRAEGSLNKDLFCGGGGAIGANKEDYAAYMRFAFRSSLKGSSVIWNLGFRCVKDIVK